MENTQCKTEMIKQFMLANATCSQCDLANARTNIVFGRGNPDSKVMFVGEGPGESEDLQGQPFVGAAGKLLSLVLDALDISENQYYITNIVKCRPPSNRNPSSSECAACISLLREQFRIIRPQIIVCLGAVAAKNLLGDDLQITKARGHWVMKGDVWFMPTFHPAALLRDETKKACLYMDLKAVKEKVIELELSEGDTINEHM